MSPLVEGANTALTSTRVRLVPSWTAGAGVPDVDASALLVTATGRVRGDKDLGFYDQRHHPSGAAVHSGKRTGPTGPLIGYR
ncbi:TerD family protein [Polymorphospora sp. NPDC050346]|uniref:TerD family protein n=1 Tax=Polymorphospora sp. NPDC050346 TaxID=3155780 RepID=UPI0033D95E04